MPKIDIDNNIINSEINFVIFLFINLFFIFLILVNVSIINTTEIKKKPLYMVNI